MKMNSHEFSLDGGTFNFNFVLDVLLPTDISSIFFTWWRFFGVHMCAMADLDLSHTGRVYMCVFMFFLGDCVCVCIYIYIDIKFRYVCMCVWLMCVCVFVWPEPVGQVLLHPYDTPFTFNIWVPETALTIGNSQCIQAFNSLSLCILSLQGLQLMSFSGGGLVLKGAF